ncbi:cell cycle regulator of non-homologous end joining [Ochotona princeps]|uniref:cell cycle regulator of non-homologous end joining n=1 Tax=Ochotona princeps TaxID=9978 RepID=UPI0027155ADD|nr:cell cycle regulator of non-homologous end joining [Ochotona princeps]XP_058537318.1 cell cycle regulator of non-homologous end joining [Ochotona princeps]XP_058537319.1 cell cycle regulator of non-homologous end joining [Ochotona princeps]
MAELTSGNKKRVLPPWMTVQVAEKRKVPAQTPKRRMAAAPARMAARPVSRTVYCMNEAEIVAVALGILIEDRKQEKPWQLPSLADTQEPEASSLSPSPSPHTSSGSSDEEAGGSDAPMPGFGPAHGEGSSGPEEEEEEDAFKYVREIFFS